MLEDLRATERFRVGFGPGDNAGLGRDDDLLAPPAHCGTHDLLRAVGRSRVDEVDAEIKRRADDGDALFLASAVRLAEAAVTAATEPGNADIQSGTAENFVLHDRLLPGGSLAQHEQPPNGARSARAAARHAGSVERHATAGAEFPSELVEVEFERGTHHLVAGNAFFHSGDAELFE